jgi:hypothetical protein
MSAHLWNLSGTRQTRSTIARTIPGARAFFYVSETTTPLTVYEDADFTTAHDDPVEADAFGEWPAVYIPAGTYKVRVLDDEGSLLFEHDNVVAPGVESEDELVVTPFVETLFDDADAATFLATLGFHAYVIANVIGLATAAASRTLFDVQQYGIVDIIADSASRALALTDVGRTLEMTNAAARIYTIPANATVAFPVGTWINVARMGAGALNITADNGVTFNGIASAGAATCAISAQYQGATLRKTATNTWGIVGSHSTVA